MSTYDTLVADVASYFARDDLTAPRLQSFVALAEDRHASDLRVRAMTKRSRAVGNGTRFVALPFDFLDMRVLRFADDLKNELHQEGPNAIFEPAGDLAGDKATEYAVHEELEFNRPVAETEELEMIYWGRFPRLSPAVQTNWLIANDYGSYLYATLVEASPFVRVDSEQLSIWEAAYQTHKSALQSRDNKSRVGGQPAVRMKYKDSVP